MDFALEETLDPVDGGLRTLSCSKASEEPSNAFADRAQGALVVLCLVHVLEESVDIFVAEILDGAGTKDLVLEGTDSESPQGRPNASGKPTSDDAADTLLGRLGRVADDCGGDGCTALRGGPVLYLVDILEEGVDLLVAEVFDGASAKDLVPESTNSESSQGRLNASGKPTSDDAADTLLGHLGGVADNRCGDTGTLVVLASNGVNTGNSCAAGYTADHAVLDDVPESIFTGPDEFPEKGA
ncbi:hypothetical protein B0H17DRAFT_1069499 [Mycena rosella]|uniref:Uncharacterized protein n=1 Tax=Mycena rosella TaxID=1033263 RepID=A0AAD7GET4_MYCRO|nr:hypothetical protein B0H17DRAFT_1069499 [Mycena rosella]